MTVTMSMKDNYFLMKWLSSGICDKAAVIMLQMLKCVAYMTNHMTVGWQDKK